MLNSRRITAKQIFDSENTIKSIIKSKIVHFNTGRIRLAYKNARETLNIEKLSEEQKTNIKNVIINDEISQEYKDKTYNQLKSEFENYKHIRSNINNINDLGVDAVEIEDLKLIEMKEFHKVISSSINENETFIKILNKQKRLLYADVFDLVDNKTKIDDIFNIIKSMYSVSDNIDDFELIAKYGYLNNIDYGLELSNHIIKQNYPVFQHINKNSLSQVSNKFLSYLFSDKITNNKTTLFPNTLNSNINYQRSYRLRSLGELLLMISDPKTKFKSKKDREQLYINNDGTRPNENEYRNWNGLQVFDLDLKNWINHENGDIDKLKLLIHSMMLKHHWYLWIVKSASGNGLHIYTKVAPPHHQYTNPSDNEVSSKFWFNVNYITKLNFVYSILDGLNKKYDLFNYKKFDNPFVDNVVSRVTAGIRLSYDENPFVNNYFVDLSLLWGLGNNVNKDILNDDELHDYLKQDITNEKTIIYGKTINTARLYKKKIDLINDIHYKEKNNLKDVNVDTNKININNLPSHVKLANDLSVIKTLNRNKINYFTRYNVCNTLAGIMGIGGLSIAHEVLKSEELGNVDEINAFYTCALSNGKTPTKLGLEILKKIGIIKNISDDLKVEIQEGFKNDLKIEIEKVLDNDLPEFDFKLSDNEYLGDYKFDILNKIVGSKISIIFSPPGSGKTTFITELSQSKRVLLVLPYISVIKNKVENEAEITANFDVFYGSKSLKDLQYGRSAVTTFDKFSKSNYEKIARMFDYVMIDESHLLFTSSYRIEATANSIKKIKDLFYISNNDEEAAKIVLMTGTETGETHFFNDVGNVIRIFKNQPNKNMEFVLCDDGLDAVTRMSNYAANLIKEGYRLLIPTNKGDIYTTKLIFMTEHLLGRELKTGYYKRSNTEQEICQMIDVENTVGDYEIVFCSNYLSVGVDINDGDKKFASLYYGDFSGYEIEQFNARIRKTGIESKFFIVTEKENGEIYNSLIEEPNLILKVTDNDKLFFIDDEAIASAKQEFIAEYDSVLQKITTPGFSLMNGKIQFNIDEYQLISFENKYCECMQHPVKVARELAKYGYNVSVSNEFDGLNNSLKNVLKQTGIEGAKQEKIRKHNLLYNTFIELINSNTYVSQFGLEFNNVIEWARKALRDGKVVEDRSMEKHLDIVFDAFASPQRITVKSKESFEKIIGYAHYLINRYSKTKAIAIFEKYVDSNGVIKLKQFKRAINLLKLMDGAEKNELSTPLVNCIEKIYNYVDGFESNSNSYASYNAYQAQLDLWTNEYITDLGIKINTRRSFDKIRDSILELMMDISKKSTSKKGIRFTYQKLPEQNSNAILNKRSIDELIDGLFNVMENHTNQNIVKTKHIVLKDQDF